MSAGQIDIYVDIASAEAYLALPGTLGLLERTGLPATWHPISAPKVKALPIRSDESVSERHQRVRAEYRQMDRKRYAKWLGLTLATPIATIDERAVAAGIVRAQQQDLAPQFLNALFSHYWGGGTDPVNEDFVSAHLPGSEPLSLDDGAMALAGARDLGLFDAPTYVIEGERFIGRQHLPLIERIAAEGAAQVIPGV